MNYNEFVESPIGLKKIFERLFDIDTGIGHLRLKSFNVTPPQKLYTDCMISMTPYTYMINGVVEVIDGISVGEEMPFSIEVPKMCERGFLIIHDGKLKWRAPVNIGKVKKSIQIRGRGDSAKLVIRPGINIFPIESNRKPRIEVTKWDENGSPTTKIYDLYKYLKLGGITEIDSLLSEYPSESDILDTYEQIELPEYYIEKFSNKYLQLTKLESNISLTNPFITANMIWELIKLFFGNRDKFELFTPVDLEIKSFYNVIFENELLYVRDLRNKIAYEAQRKHKIYDQFITDLLNNVFNMLGEENAIQAGSLSNALSFISQTNKLYIKEWNKDTQDYAKTTVHYTDDFYGVICPAKTPESVGLCGIKNELANNVSIVDDKIMIEVMTKDLKLITIDYMTYFKSRVLLSDNFNYEDNVIKPVYNSIKIIHLGEFETVPAKESEFDYIMSAPESGLAMNSGLIPFMNRSDGTRLAMSTNMQDQAIPIVGGVRSVVTTRISRDLYNKTDLNWKSEVSGTVVDIYNGFIKIECDDGNVVLIPTPDAFESSNHSYNLFRPAVNIGDKVKKGSVLIECNSFKNNKLALTTPLVTGFYEMNSLSDEDAFIISERAAEAFGHPVMKRIVIDIPNDREFILNKDKVLEKLSDISTNYRRLKSAGINKPIEELNIDKLDPFGLPKVGDQFERGELLNIYLMEPIEEIRQKLNELIKNKIDNINYDLFVTKVPYGLKTCTVESVEVYWKPSAKMNPKYKDIIEFYEAEAQSRKRDLINHLGNYEFPERKEILTESEYDPLFRIVIKVSSINPVTIGAKIANRYGGKGTISKILPVDKMPRIGGPDGTPLDICMPSPSVINRKNISQIYEANLSYLSFICYQNNANALENNDYDAIRNNLNKLYVTDKFSKFSDKELRDFHESQDNNYYTIEVGAIDNKYTNKVFSDLNKYFGTNIDGDELYIPEFNKMTKNKVTTGVVEFMRLHFNPEDKAKATSNVKYNDELAMGLGKGRFGGQKIGQMELWVLTAFGVVNDFKSLQIQAGSKESDKSSEFMVNEFDMRMLLLGTLRITKN